MSTGPVVEVRSLEVPLPLVHRIVRNARHSGISADTLRQAVRVLLTGGVLLFSAGCLQFEESMTLNADGSADVVFHYTIETTALPALARFRAAVDQWQQGHSRVDPKTAPADLFDRRLIKQFLNEAGAELVSYRTETREDRKQVWVTCRTPDVRKAFRTGVFGDFSLRKTDTGDWLLESSSELPGTPPPDDARGDAFHELCRGLKLRLTIIVPGAIVRTSANESSGRRAVWEIDFGPKSKTGPQEKQERIFVLFRGNRVHWK